MVRESAMSVCPIPCPRRTSRDSAGVYTRVYMKRMSGEQTPTAVNIVLLKNRTLVNVFERVRNGGRGRVEFGREEVGRGWLTFFLPSLLLLLLPFLSSIIHLYPSKGPPLDLTRNLCGIQFPFYRF